jgi:hypothetical protein
MLSDQIKPSALLKPSFLLLSLFCWQLLIAQNKIDLSDLKEFNNAAGNWHITGDVKADFNKSHDMSFSPGVGILVNLPNESAREDLYTNLKHGDIDLELDCMMAKESNSGIYLQGRYEIQLLDSWGVLNPRSSDIGGIYERYDESRPEGRRNVDGHAPRQNASKAPGLWQHFKISFQAPRFEAGVKVKNAKILLIELNGVVIQENIELYAPTAGAVENNEVAEDALRIQGDHGQVAFRNMVITNYSKQQPTLSSIVSTVFKGKFEHPSDLANAKPAVQKPLSLITTNIEGLPENDFLVKYSGIIHVNEPGQYNFKMDTKGGTGSLTINKNALMAFGKGNQDTSMTLQAGDFPIEVVYSKYMGWEKPSIVLKVDGPGVREFIISDASNIPVDVEDPVLVAAAENTILRSFMDLPTGKRITHSINVGTPEKVHYTYDMNNGMVVQAWRGGFLDASPMWISRGDGSSSPMGVVEHFGKPSLLINKLANPNAEWATDTTGSGFVPKGYVLDEQDRPSFKYKIYGAMVTDIIRVMEDRHGLQREIKIENGSDNLYFRLADASTILEVAPGLFTIGDKYYYIKIALSDSIHPIIREVKGRKELVVAVKDTFTYSILF